MGEQEAGRMSEVVRFACRFCRHNVATHNGIEGCVFCWCAATPYEAGPRTDAELDARVLSASEKLPMYQVSQVGRTRLRHHAPQAYCSPCPIHAPSGHHMVGWDMLWRNDRGIMERVCVHGVGHPDPDDRKIRLGEDSGVHGCDGCCNPSPVIL